MAPCEIECSFYMAVVKHSSIDGDPNDDNIEAEIPKMYLKVQSLIEFDTFVTTHGPFTSVDSGKKKEYCCCFSIFYIWKMERFNKIVLKNRY